VAAFRRRWGADPSRLIRAPGRVNLIGEHTDYNEGFVLPMAIDRSVWIVLRPRRDRRVLAEAVDFDGQIDFDLQHFDKGETGWAEYVKGVAWSMAAAGSELSGWEGAIAGDVPIGAGLSSSAALEIAAARAFAEVAASAWEPLEVARLAQRAENDWVGVPCGIMDQLISAAGVAGHALLIDCRTLGYEPVPLPGGVDVVILDTGTRRGLLVSAYDERRRQCQEAADRLGVKSLRDVGIEELRASADRLPAVTYRRARHVVTEIERTQLAAKALLEGQAGEVGRLMDASHVSLRDDFEVSSPELDAIVAVSQQQSSCLGARLTGAGFGGCAVSLVRREGLEAFLSEVGRGYEARTGRRAGFYVCAASGGAEVERT
jgi:galactokinase